MSDQLYQPKVQDGSTTKVSFGGKFKFNPVDHGARRHGDGEQRQAQPHAH